MFMGFEALGFSGISEGPEDRFAIGGEAEFTLDWGVLIYAATHEYITRTEDDPPNQAFYGTLEKAFRIDRSIIGANRIGEDITIGYGEVSLSNLEHDYDFLAVDITPLGQRIVIKFGDRRRPYSEWRTVLDGFMTALQPDRDSVTFTLRDAGHKLDVPASPNVYLGTGGTEGDSDLTSKRKPRAFGWLLEVSPPLVIPASLAFQLNDGQVNAVTAVRVKGVEQIFSANYTTVALMNAAALTIGHYATCLAEGWMRIAVASGDELGQVTCDFSGDKAGGVFAETAADIVERLLDSATEFVVPDDLATATFDQLNTDQPAPIGYLIPVGDEQTVATAVAAIMASVGGWGGSRRTGKFEVRRFEEPSGAPAGRYSRTNVQDVKLAVLPDDISPPPWRVRVAWGKIWTPNQTNLAGTVSDDYRAFLSQEVRFATAEDENIRNDFPPGHELVEENALFRDEADALAEAERKLELFGVSRNLYVFQLNEPLFVHELGQTVFLQFDDRFDLDEGRLMTIVKLTEDDAEGVEITAFA
jgi:hypothetical protein